jgi:thiol-disulfide isomerase/thioredoxin
MTPAQKLLHSRRAWFLVAALAASTFWSLDRPAAEEDPNSGEIRKTLLAHSFERPDGERFSMKEFTGQILVVNFWASWCKPCKREMPLMEKLHVRLSAGSGHVLAVSVDRDPGRVQKFLEENELDLPVFVDGPNGLAKKLDLDYLPYTIVMDADGAIVFAGASGADKQWARLNSVIEGLLVGGKDSASKEKLKS